MKALKKIKLHYQEIAQWLREYDDGYVNEDEDGGKYPVLLYKTREGGFGLRRRFHGWKPSDTVWTEDGTMTSEIIAMVGATDYDRQDALVGELKNAAYMVNRFASEEDRIPYLKELEKKLLEITK